MKLDNYCKIQGQRLEAAYTRQLVNDQEAEKLSRFLVGEEALHDNHKLSVANHFCFPTQDPGGSVQEKKKDGMELGMSHG